MVETEQPGMKEPAGSKRLLLGIVGFPVGHSLSGVIHEAFMKSACITGEYQLIPVFPPDLSETIIDLFKKGFAGLNITLPHKVSAVKLCSEISADVKSIGAVNTLVRRKKGWRGENTDTIGFRSIITEENLHRKTFVLFGSGGAARAVASAITDIGADLHIVCRRPSLWQRQGVVHNISELNKVIQDIENGVFINATTLGWKRDDLIPVNAELLRNWFFIDLNYRRDWLWRNSLKENNVRVIPGEKLLVYQAIEAFRLWTGLTASRETGFEVIRSFRENP